MIGKVEFSRVAPDREFHTAVVELAPGTSVPLHEHDFWEVALTIGGVGSHTLAGLSRPVRLEPGTLLLIRPSDRHSLRSGIQAPLQLINVAFPEEYWRGLCSLSGLDGVLTAWSEQESPPMWRLSGAGRFELELAFRRTLADFAKGAGRVGLLALFGVMLPLLAGREGPGTDTLRGTPAWLDRALAVLSLPSYLRGGVEVLREESGVSAAHLSRTVRKHLGITPTELVNNLRLRRAELLLLTTNLPVIEVSAECGFENLSYFYRLFRLQHGLSPAAFRQQARPSQSPTEMITYG